MSTHVRSSMYSAKPLLVVSSSTDFILCGWGSQTAALSGVIEGSSVVMCFQALSDPRFLLIIL